MEEPHYQALDFSVHKKCSRGWRTRFDSVLIVKHSLADFQITRFSGTVRGDLWAASRGTFRNNPLSSAHSKKNNHKGFLFVFLLLIFCVVFRINSFSFCVAPVLILFIFGVVGDKRADALLLSS